MSGYANKRTYELRYSDFDFKDELSLSALLSLAQESAGASADELGFGYAALKEAGFWFIVANTFCKFFRPVKLGGNVSVETWPLPPRRLIFERDYRVTQAGVLCAALASRWCLVDLRSFRLLPPERLGAVHENCPYRDERAVEVPAWKIPQLEEARKTHERAVLVSDCDHYFHANNARYADFFMDCFSMDELAFRSVQAFQISYLKQAKAGSELAFYRRDEGCGSICEARCGGEAVARFRIFFGEEKADV